MLRRAPFAVALVAGLYAAAPAEAAVARPLPVEALGTLSPALAGAPASGPVYERAYDAWDEARTQLARARRDATSAAGARADAEAEAVRVDGERRVRARAHEQAAERLAERRAAMVDVAVAGFMDGPQSALVPPDEAPGAARQAVFGDVVRDRSVDGFQAAEAKERETRAAAQSATEAARAAVVALDEARTAAGTAARRLETWGRALAERTAALVAAAPLAELDGTDLTLVTVDAYVRAAETSGGCVTWPLLAGIGRVETRHGTYRGSSVAPTGDVVPRIVGIALDGTNETMAIGDTDGGALDGDASTDRAVGPMQFIPSTWRTSGLDGNADGVADPNNLYDAAASAAAYLCRAGGAANVGQAVFSYNRSAEYVQDVTTAAASYATVDW